MKALFLEIPVSIIVADERYRDNDTRHIYEHLNHMFSLPRLFPLPAIYAQLVDGRLVVTRGHIYLRIARELGDEWIRAIVQCDGIDSKVILKQLPPGVRVIPREEMEREEAIPVIRDWHVYFFDDPLSSTLAIFRFAACSGGTYAKPFFAPR